MILRANRKMEPASAPARVTRCAWTRPDMGGVNHLDTQSMTSQVTPRLTLGRMRILCVVIFFSISSYFYVSNSMKTGLDQVSRFCCAPPSGRGRWKSVLFGILVFPYLLAFIEHCLQDEVPQTENKNLPEQEAVLLHCLRRKGASLLNLLK